MPFVPSPRAHQALGVSQTYKRNGWTYNFFLSTSSASRSHTTPYSLRLLLSISTPSGMAATAVYATQVFAGRYPHEHGHGRTSPPPSPLSATLVEPPRPHERPSIELKISSSRDKIVNATVVDPAGRPLYSISSDDSRTKLLSLRDNTEIATVNWDRSSPRMVFRGKKVKCKEWLPRAGPDTEYVLLLLSYASYSELGWYHKSGLVYSRTAIRGSHGCSNPIVAS